MLAMASCSSDFLDKVPSGNYTAETFYASDDAVMKGVEPLYNKAWFNFNRRALVGMGSYRANDAWNPYVSAEFAKFQVTALTEDMSLAWSSLYNVVTMSNATLDNLNNYCTDDVTESVKNAAIGECYLMRGWAFFYLLRGWGDVILFEDNQAMVDNPVVPLNPETDVLKFIVRDFRNAAEYLPETGSDNHPSKYAAKAALAKALLAQSGWDSSSKADHERDQDILNEVVTLCDEVINCGQYALMSDYEDLFKAQNNDNEETILAMRWADPSTNEWGAMNALYSDLAFADVSDVSVWGENLCASVDMFDLYNEDITDQTRMHGTFFFPGSYYSYIKASEGGYTYTRNWANLKKGVLGYKSDVSPCNLAMMASPLNTYIQRLADVYLMKAEALLGNNSSTSNAEALAAFNAIRNRAGVKEYTSISFDDILRERRIEFCMEYSNWWEMVTYYRWKPQTMLNYFNYKQHRGWMVNSGDVEINSDGTIRYRAVYPGNNAWYMYNYFTDDSGVTHAYCYWNDCVKDEYDTDSEGNYKVVMTTADGYDYAAIREQYVADLGSDYQPITLSEANIFMAYPESDVIQNAYFNMDPQSYDFGE